MPSRDFVKKKHLAKFDQRVLALSAVLDGASIQRAANAYGVDRTTLTTMVETVATLAPDGRPFGYRVCIPWYRVAESDVTQVEVPLASSPNAFSRLLAALPNLKELVHSFKGKLPAHNEPSAKFEVFFRKFVAYLKNKELECHYPLNSTDRGRRALQNWIKRERKEIRDLQMGDNEDLAYTLTRLDQLLKLQPLDRVELDGHKTDCDWHAQIPTRDGKWTTELVSAIWILAAIDVVSLVAFPCTLVIGPSYDRYDVLETFANTLRPWEPRNLIVPDLRYAPDAWMPTMGRVAGDVYRPASTAIDNFLAHKAKITTENIGDHQLGVVNLGFPYVPEGRPNIEAFFKRLEDAVLRQLAGGFRPLNERNGKKQAVSTKAAKTYPVNAEALRDLIDVEISAYNVTPHPALQHRTPREVFESHIHDGMWTTQSFLTAEDTAELLVLHKEVTIRGNRRKGVLPYVKYQHAKYRSRKLNNRYDLVGRTFWASIHSHSAHQISLWDDDGNLLVVLQALRPWGVPHSLQQRSAVLKCTKRGLLNIEGTDDALAAYHEFVRTKASEIQWATDAYLKEGLKQTQHATKQAKPSLLDQLNSLSGLAPRAGHVDLRQRRKP
jgi:putative transposase